MLSGFLGFVWERCVSTVPCGRVRWGMTYPTLCGVHLMNHCLGQLWKVVCSCFSISVWVRKSHSSPPLTFLLFLELGICIPNLSKSAITCQRWDRPPIFFQEWWVLQGPRNDNFVIISDLWGKQRVAVEAPESESVPGFVSVQVSLICALWPFCSSVEWEFFPLSFGGVLNSKILTLLKIWSLMTSEWYLLWWLFLLSLFGLPYFLIRLQHTPFFLSLLGAVFSILVLIGWCIYFLHWIGKFQIQSSMLYLCLLQKLLSLVNK